MFINILHLDNIDFLSMSVQVDTWLGQEDIIIVVYIYYINNLWINEILKK
jgi:hypothetical protein